MSALQIVSVAPETFRARRPSYNGVFELPAAKPGQYSIIKVADHTDHKKFYHDLTNVDVIDVTITAKEIKLGMKILDHVFHKLQSKKSEGCACSNH